MSKVLFEQKPTGQSYVVQLRDKDCDVTYTYDDILEIKRTKGYILLLSKDSIDFVPDTTMFTVSDGQSTDCEAYTDEIEMGNLAELMAHMQQGD